MKKPNRVFELFAQILLLIFVFIPILWGIRTSFARSTHDMSLIPRELTLRNYQVVMSSRGFVNAMKNSVIYAFGTIAILLLIVIPAAYALSRLRFRGRGAGIILLFLPLLPVISLLIPLARNLNNMGMYNTMIGVVLLTVTFQLPFTCWLLRNFIQTIPAELEDAAYVDGCTKLSGLFYIILPNCMTGIISIVIFSFISTWLSYLIPYAIVSYPEKFALSQLLLLMEGQFSSNYPQLTAAALLTLLPPLVFFCFFQKWFIAGLFGITMK
jgi:ABC-type glycerol-3-phosphate transport system permease component